MSGIEVAGLVLGAIPLVIAGLEHWRETAELFEDYWQHKRKYVKCKRELQYLQLSFSANLEELLLPLICDDEQIAILMASPGGKEWRDVELEERLRKRLSTAYELYVDSIEDFKDAIERLTREIGFDEMCADMQRGKISSESILFSSVMTKVKDQKNRLRFALGQTTREKLFEECSKLNERLRSLVSRTDQLEKLKTTRKSQDKAIVRMTAMLWKRAATLYKLLYKAWVCKCQAFHQANLRLQDRTTEDSLSCFDVTFLFSAMQDGAQRPWNCQNTSIVVIDKPIRKVLSTPTIPLPLSPSNSMEKIAGHSPVPEPRKPSLLRKIKAKKTSFVTDSTTCFTNITTIVEAEIATLTVTGPDAGHANCEQPQNHPIEVTDLCNVLQSTSKHDENQCCGMLHEGGEHYQIFPKSTPCQTDNARMISLKELLDQNSEIKLTRRQRYSLASAMASSEVQLHSTPWLAEQWDKSQVLFFKQQSKARITISEDARLATDFTSPIVVDSEDHTSERDLKPLGILLIELCFGIALENTAIRQKYPNVPGPQNVYMDIAAALELCETVSEEAGPEYASAVDWCLKKPPSKTATDTEWRMELYENVVKPLQQCHGHLVKSI